MTKFKSLFKKLALSFFVVPALCVLTGCNKKDTQKVESDVLVKSIEINGEPTKTLYSFTDEYWDFDGINVVLTYEDSKQTTLPITDNSITFEYWPLGPYKISSDKGSLYINSVSYTSPSGQVVENKNRKTYTFTFEQLTKEKKTDEIVANLIVLIYIPTITFTLIVLFKKEEIEKL